MGSGPAQVVDKGSSIVASVFAGKNAGNKPGQNKLDKQVGQKKANKAGHTLGVRFLEVVSYLMYRKAGANSHTNGVAHKRPLECPTCCVVAEVPKLKPKPFTFKGWFTKPSSSQLKG